MELSGSLSPSLKDLFYKSEDYFFRAVSSTCLDFDNMATAYLTGVDFSYLNPFYVRKNIVSIEEMLNHAKVFYDTHNYPWCAIISEDLTFPAQEKALKNIASCSFEKSVAMVFEFDDQNHFNNNGNTIIKRTDKNLKDWMVPLTEAFKSTVAISNQYVLAHARALGKNAYLYHFTVYKDNMPVSSLTSSICQNMARLDDIGTLPAYQKQGHATHLINHALSEAKNRGATFCFLEAAASAYSFYKKLGFKTLYKYMNYSFDKSNKQGSFSYKG